MFQNTSSNLPAICQPAEARGVPGGQQARREDKHGRDRQGQEALLPGGARAGDQGSH